MSLSEARDQKAAAAAAAVELVEDGMLLGLGTGTTSEVFVSLLGARVRAGLRVTGVPTSRAAEELALRSGIPVVHAVDRRLDLAVDGADEVDGGLRLIKGRGGALVREKLVAMAAERFVVIADASKLVARLGVGVLPVEVMPFLWPQTARRLEALGATGQLRGGEERPFVSDNGNLIVDLTFAGGIADADTLAGALKAVAGVVDHGLFIGLASTCLVGTPDGVRRLGA